MFWHRGPASKYLEDTYQIYSDYEEKERAAGGTWRDACMQQPGGWGWVGACTQLLTYECLLASPPKNETAISAQGRKKKNNQARAGLAAHFSTSLDDLGCESRPGRLLFPVCVCGGGAFQQPGI